MEYLKNQTFFLLVAKKKIAPAQVKRVMVKTTIPVKSTLTQKALITKGASVPAGYGATTFQSVNPVDQSFKPIDLPLKPYVAISVRDRIIHRKIISEFYLKFPQLRWITFRDMVSMSYEDFAKNLKECMVSLWVDDESTFGTFPLESMKCGVPVVGKIPDTEPDWLTENGVWTYDGNKLVELLGTYILTWIEGGDLNDEVKDKMKDTLLPYNQELTKNNIISIFDHVSNH